MEGKYAIANPIHHFRSLYHNEPQLLREFVMMGIGIMLLDDPRIIS